MNSTTIIFLAIALIVLGVVMKRRETLAGISSVSEVAADRAAGATIVDVRTPGEYAAGHIDGALNIPLSEVARRVDEFQKMDGPILLCCESGRRSGGALLILRKRGVTNTKNAGPYRRLP